MTVNLKAHAEVQAVAPNRGHLRSLIVEHFNDALGWARRDFAALGIPESEFPVEGARAVCAFLVAQLHQGQLDVETVAGHLESTAAWLRSQTQKPVSEPTPKAA